MEVVSLVLCTVIAVAAFAVYWIKNNHDYWRKRGVPHEEGVFPYGIWTTVRKTKRRCFIFNDLYDKFKGSGPFAGFHMFTRPSVVLLDLDLVKNVIIRDFNNFDKRGDYYHERHDPLRANLVSLEAEKWRPLRGKLSSTFTSGKMKYMFPTIVEVGKHLVATVERECKTHSDLEMRDLLARFTTDVIGTCVFGIECNCLEDPNVIFRKMGDRVFQKPISLKNHFLTSIFPKVAHFIGFASIYEDVTKFFTKLVIDTVEYRETNGIQRNDFMDLCIRLKNGKSIRLGDGEELSALSLAEIIPQAFVFFAAGYHTSSTALSFALYELACNPDVQDKLRREITDTLAKHGEELTYESIKDMTYLDQVIHETLRMFPPSVQLRRVAKNDYPTSDPKYVIPKDAYVMVPIFAIHRDPEIYPNPDAFDPDRFRPEEVQKRHPMSWLAFGDGPRNCIGSRFAKQQVSIGLSLLVKSFKFSVTKDTAIPMKFNNSSFLLAAEKGIVLKVEKL